MTITALSKADHADRRPSPLARPHAERRRRPHRRRGRVVDDDDRELPVGEIGEVVVRGDVVMAGYWNQPDATAETLRGGWLHTGDIGSFDAEGYLTLRDRSKDLIISGGMNIYPREVEEALLHHAGVRAVAVVGRPDPEWGETVVAFVVAADGDAAAAGRRPRPDVPRPHRPLQAAQATTASSTPCRPTTTARWSSGSCATGCAARRRAARLPRAHRRLAAFWRPPNWLSYAQVGSSGCAARPGIGRRGQ